MIVMGDDDGILTMKESQFHTTLMVVHCKHANLGGVLVCYSVMSQQLGTVVLVGSVVPCGVGETM